MFRQTPFTQSDLSRSFVARETRTKVRYFDPKTARMSGWMPKQTKAQRTAATLLAPMLPELEERVAKLEREESLNAMTVPQLRDLYEAKYGLRPTTRTKKPALVGKILGA